MRNLLRRINHKSCWNHTVIIHYVDLFALSLVSRHKVLIEDSLTFVERKGRIVCLSIVFKRFLSELRLISVVSFPNFLLAFHIFSSWRWMIIRIMVIDLPARSHQTSLDFLAGAIKFIFTRILWTKFRVLWNAAVVSWLGLWNYSIWLPRLSRLAYSRIFKTLQQNKLL